MNRNRSNRRTSRRTSSRIKSRRTSRRTSRRKSRRKSRRTLKVSKRLSRNKFRKYRKSKRNRRPKFGMTVNDIYDIYGVIMIYGRDSCPACIDIKEFCNQNSIKYQFIVRDSTDEKQNTIINNSIEGYNYIPVIISSKTNKFLGGSQDFKNLVKENK